MTTTSLTLGDYDLIKKIGQGSLGTVYLGEHRFMHKQFAIKVLPPELSQNRAFISRFQEEIASLASLDHPNIVKVHNVSFSDGKYFLVTDCVVDEIGETTNLSQFLASRNSPLQEETLFSLLEQVADALDYAHTKTLNSHRMAHRGLKLNNLLVCQKESKHPQLLLSDFGLSRIVGSGAVLSRTYKTLTEALAISDANQQAANQEEGGYPSQDVPSQKLTRLHTSFLQNYAFLAPEQKHSGQSNEALAYKMDIYSFGILSYYLISQKFPEGIFPMPSEARKDLVYNWDSLISACLQLDPNQRPDSLKKLLMLVSKQKNLHSPKIAPLVEALPEDTSPSLAPKIQTLRQSSSIINEAIQNAPNSSLRPLLKPLIEEGELKKPSYDPDPAASLTVDPSVKVYHPQTQPKKEISPIHTDMNVIEGGEFYRGSNEGNRDEQPLHKVFLDSFAIDIHPVTNEQFIRFLEALDGLKDQNNNDVIRLRESRILKTHGQFTFESGYSKHPVVGVTWYGAVAYAKWVGKRLPTEAEWEVAAKGSLEKGEYPTGVDIEKNQANFFSSDTTSVMSYQPNNIGIFDMVGNVYEWCQDWYGYNYYEISSQEPQNPQGPLQGVYRVLRGGCWKSLKEDLRFTHRNRNNPGTFNRTYGFRCASNVEPVKKSEA